MPEVEPTESTGTAVSGRTVFAVVVGVVVLLSVVSWLLVRNPTEDGAGATSTGNFPVSTPEKQGMDSGLLADLVEFVVASGGIDSIMVVRNGYVVLDTVVYPFPEDTTHILHSATKSVTATLIGIAIDQGLLAGVDVPVVEILADDVPDSVDELKASMTVENLLTMSTGLDCRDSILYEWEGIEEMMATDDWAANVLALPMAEEPGSHFEYCNGASYLLSAILTEVTGTTASEYAAGVLFEPLGITDYVWPASPEGVTVGWGELVLKPADMAKIGYLYLRGGEWNGEQVVSREWVEAATTAQIDAGTVADWDYGYQWWIDDTGYVMAVGFGGQYIMVVPDRDLAVVFTSGLSPSGLQKPEGLINHYVFPAIVSLEPLPPDDDGQTRLAEAVEAARSAPEPAPIDLPPMATVVDGARYEFRPNDYGNHWFALSSGEATASLRLGVSWPLVLNHPLRYTDNGAPVDIDIGLDGRFLTGEAWGQPIAARGTWLRDDTFLVEYQFIHMISRGTFKFTFGEDVASMEVREQVGGTIQWSLADRVD